MPEHLYIRLSDSVRSLPLTFFTLPKSFLFGGGMIYNWHIVVDIFLIATRETSKYVAETINCSNSNKKLYLGIYAILIELQMYHCNPKSISNRKCATTVIPGVAKN